MKHSVVIPAFNAAAYLADCLHSVLPQLGAHDQVIIVDDGSNDNTWSIIDQWLDKRIVGLRQPSNTGIAAARNRGLTQVTGDYIHFLDHDDLWPTNRMAYLKSLLTDALVKDIKPDIISGWVAHFYCPSLAPLERAKRLLPEPQAASLPGSVVISRDTLGQLGTFDTGLTSGEFVDFLAKAQTQSLQWFKVQEVMFYRRIHAHNHTLKDDQMTAAYLSVIRRHLARVRTNRADSVAPTQSDARSVGEAS
jgi:glycosyltransferase involved in cell wall biosynthesis